MSFILVKSTTSGTIHLSRRESDPAGGRSEDYLITDLSIDEAERFSVMFDEQLVKAREFKKSINLSRLDELSKKIEEAKKEVARLTRELDTLATKIK